MDGMVVCFHGDLYQEGSTWQQILCGYQGRDCVVYQLPYEHHPVMYDFMEFSALEIL